MTYRPTVRYSTVYKKYVDAVFKATTLDRNQIIRLALFVSAHSPEYINILKKYKIGDVSLPHPDWGLDEEDCWKKASYIPKTRPSYEKSQHRSIKLVNQGGIKFVVD